MVHKRVKKKENDECDDVSRILKSVSVKYCERPVCDECGASRPKLRKIRDKTSVVSFEGSGHEKASS